MWVGAENIWSLKQFSEVQGQENRKQSQLSCKLLSYLLIMVFVKAQCPGHKNVLQAILKKKNQGC